MSAAPAALPAVGELCRFEGHGSWVLSVAWSPDGRCALSGSGQPPQAEAADGDFSVRLWDVAAALELGTPAGPAPVVRGERVRLRGHDDRVTGVAFLPGGRAALSCSYDLTLRVWDLDAGRERGRLVGHDDRVRCLAVSPDGRHALSGGCDGTLRLWDLGRGREAHRFPGHRHWVTAVAFAPDGRLALSGGLDGAVRLWRVTGGPVGGWLAGLCGLGRVEVARFGGHRQSVTGVAFCPAGRLAASAGADGAVLLWDVKAAKEARRLLGHRAGVAGVAFAPGGRVLSGGMDRTVRLWSAETGEELHRFEGHQDAVTSVALSPDGRFALSGSADRTVRVWGLPPPRS